MKYYSDGYSIKLSGKPAPLISITPHEFRSLRQWWYCWLLETNKGFVHKTYKENKDGEMWGTVQYLFEVKQ